MPPKTKAKKRLNASTAGHVLPTQAYVSTRPLRQVHFPERRTITRTYGGRQAAGRPARSPKQRTLTQIGYVIPPPIELQGLEDWDNDGVGDSGLADDKIAGFGCGHDGQSGLFAQSARRLRSPKRVSSIYFQTQTLTQFIAGDVKEGSLSDTFIEDSEDEDGLKSLQAAARKTGSLKQRQGSLQACAETLQTPTKTCVGTADMLSSSKALSTPQPSRMEIPSSQPSPFTPVVMFDRYCSPLGRERSSPLQYKNATMLPANGTVIDALIASPTRLKRPPREAPRKRKRNSDANKPTSFGIDSGISEKRPPLQPVEADISALLSSQQAAVPFSSQLSGPGCWDCEDNVENPQVFTEFAVRRQKKKEAKVQHLEVEEIPDTDEEDNEKAEEETTMAPAASKCPVGDLDGQEQDARQEDDAVAVETGGSVLPHPIGCARQEQSQVAKTLQYQSQAMESQRVSLDTIRAMGPQTDRTDIVISIHPEHVCDITSGQKDHEFRTYRIPHTVSRFWIYTTRPVSQLQFMAVVKSGYLEPGEIDSQSGIGNAEFNAGRMTAKFAYKLEQIYQLNNPISLETMKKSGWIDGPPQRYAYVPPAVAGSLLANLRCALFEEGHQSYESLPSKPSLGERDDGGGIECGDLTVSQEVEAQIMSDMVEARTPRANYATRGAKKARNEHGVADCQDAGTLSQATTVSAQSTPVAADAHGYMGGLENGELALETQLSPRWSPMSVKNPELPRQNDGADGTHAGNVGDGVGKGDKRETVSPIAFIPRASQSSTQRSQQLYRRGSRPQPQPQLRFVESSSGGSTQLVLPDSLYEEVQQAPLATILDSEGSDVE